MPDSKTILVVDDSAVIRKILRDEFEMGGFQVVEADTAEAALDRISAHARPDLITMDIEMPGMDGFALLEKISDDSFKPYFSYLSDNTPPVVFISSLDTVEDRKKGFELGAVNFITKPFTRGQILSIANKILFPEKFLGDRLALVVDDSETARNIVAKSLKQEGVNVLQAENGAEAYEIICRHMSELDLLITDLNMPLMAGDILVEKVRKELNLADLPVIFLTAETDQGRLLELFECGGSDYLVKPFVTEELMARILVHLERRELTRRLRQNVKELSELNRLKDDLIAVCSHDLRSPLHGMLGFMDLMLEKDYLKPEDKDGLAQVKTSGKYLLELVDNILDLSKTRAESENMAMKPLNLSHVAESCFRAMKYMADRKKVTLHMTDLSDSAIVQGNRSQLMRAVNNLLSNAIKFTPSGKSVSLSLENSTGGRISIVVADQGIGIENGMIPHLFDKYSRSSRSGTKGESGTGLGMSIVKEIMGFHNGEIDVQSRVGKGSAFTLTLPLLPEDDAADEGRQASGLSVPQSPKTAAPPCKILLAEDNPINAKFTCEILRRRGHETVLAKNGWEAVASVMEDNFDIILMDIHMPGLDGLAASRRIRDAGHDTVPIIALTAESTREIEGKYADAGMNGFLIKPFKPGQVNEVLVKWVAAAGGASK